MEQPRSGSTRSDRTKTNHPSWVPVPQSDQNDLPTAPDLTCWRECQQSSFEGVRAIGFNRKFIETRLELVSWHGVIPNTLSPQEMEKYKRLYNTKAVVRLLVNEAITGCSRADLRIARQYNEAIEDPRTKAFGTELLSTVEKHYQRTCEGLAMLAERPVPGQELGTQLQSWHHEFYADRSDLSSKCS